MPEGTPERFLLYLSGSDTFGDISTLSRSDVNILAAVDTRAKRLLLVATPRDFYVSFSQTGGAKDKLTHAGIYGIQASVDALETLYGVEIDYTLRMNFTGFVEIIDALGGVSVYSDREFTVENIRTYRQGYNQLTGIEALAFARERMSFPEGDYQRAKNQMEVIRAVVEKASSPALVQNLPAVLEAVSGNFETNMPQAQILALAPSFPGLGHPDLHGQRRERLPGDMVHAWAGAVRHPSGRRQRGRGQRKAEGLPEGRMRGISRREKTWEDFVKIIKREKRKRKYLTG